MSWPRVSSADCPESALSLVPQLLLTPQRNEAVLINAMQPYACIRCGKPFGTLKAWMGATHFLTRTLAKVRTEMSLQVLAYNMKRMIQIVGVGALITAIRA